jgi:thiamine pyrophosphokinase
MEASFLRSIVVADGDIHPGAALSRALQAPDLVIAADGGALKAMSLGLRLDLVVGDGDSLAPETIAELRRDGVEVIIHPVDKDESDTELALREALARGTTSVVICGAFGGARLEHSVANLLLLTLPELAIVDAVLVDGPTTARVIGLTGAGGLVVDGVIGDYVSLLPISARVDGVTTDGLRFALANAQLIQGSTRGLSNELSSSRGEIRTRNGRLAVIHTQRGAHP